MKIGVLFPGYGSQYVGMAKELYDEYRIIQEYFEDASNCLSVNFVKLCFASSDVELSRLENSSTALFLTSSAIYALLKQEGLQPTLLAGYNSGEFAAMHAAGGLNFPDGLYLLNKFAQFYNEYVQTVPLSIAKIRGTTKTQLKELCKDASSATLRADICGYNNRFEQLISGNAEAVEKILTSLSDQEYKGIHGEHLPLEVVLHSPILEPMVNNFKIYLEKVDFKDTTIPMVSTTNGKVLQEGTALRDAVSEWGKVAIHWQQQLEEFHEVDLIIEVGPGTKLSEFVKFRYPDKRVITVNSLADVEEVKGLMSKEQPGEVASEELT